MVKILTDHNVALTNANNEYRSTYDIMKDVAAQWDNMNSMEQAALAELMSGTRQQSVFYSLIEQFQEASGAMDAMANSAGELSGAYSVYLDTTQAHINQFKATFQDLGSDVFQSDTLKGFVDTGAGILKVLDALIEKFGVFGTALPIVGIIKFKKNFDQLFTLGFSGAKDITLISDAIRGMSAEQAAAAITTSALTEAEQIQILVNSGVFASEEEAKAAILAHSSANLVEVGTTEAATAASTKFNLVLRGLWKTILAHPYLVAGAAILAVINLMKKYQEAQEEAYKSAQEAAAQSKQNLEDAKSEADQVDELINKYKELAEKDTQDIETRNEIKEVQDKILELVGQQASGLDLVNGKLDEQLEKLKQIRQFETEDMLDKANVAYHDSLEAESNAMAQKSFNNERVIYYQSGESTDSDDAIFEFLHKNGFALNAQYDSEYHTYSLTDAFDKNGNLTSGAVEKLAIIQEMIDSIKNDYNGDYLNTDLYQALITQRDAYKKVISNTDTQLQSVIQKTLDVSEFDSELSNMTVDSAESFDDYRQALIDKVKENDNVSIAIADGRLKEEDLETYVDSYMSASPDLSQFYSDWKEWKADAERIPEILNKAAEAGLDTPVMREYIDWIKSLSSSDREIVYSISAEYSGGNDPDGKVSALLKALGDGGNVDLTLRPKIDPEELRKAGWDADGNTADGDYATVFTSTFSTVDKSRAINLTPILTDENGNYIGVLSPEELEDYANSILEGADDVKKLQIGAEFKSDDIENAVQKADKAAKDIHLAEDFFYDIGDPNRGVAAMQRALDAYKNTYTKKTGTDAFDFLLNDKGTEKDPHFIDRVDKYIDKTNKLNNAYKKFAEGDFDNEDFDKLIREFPELATRSEDLGIAINELQDNMNSQIAADFANQMSSMVTDDDKDALLAWQNAILNVGKTVDEVTSRLAGDNNKTQKFINGITKAQSLLTSQKNGKSVSFADFNSEEFKDYRAALEYVNGSMQLNEDKVNEIAKAKAKEQISINKTNKALSQAKYIENARQISVYRKQLALATQARDKLEFRTKIDALLEENAGIADACAQYDLLSSTLQEATDSYQHWLNAANAADYGDMMSDAENAIKTISDTFDESSDIYGQVGSKKYQAALDFIIPDTVDHDDDKAVQKYIENLKKYFYFDKDDNLAGMDIEKFIQDSLNSGLLVFDQKSKEYKIAGGKTMEDFAEGLKLSFGMVQAFFDEMQLYGGKFDWGDEAVKTIGDLAIEANEAAEALRKIPEYGKYDFKLDFSDISTVDGQVKAIDGEIKEIDKIRAKPNIDSSELEYATSILEYLIRQKQTLLNPAIMSVDISQVDEKYRDAISLAQEYQGLVNDKEVLQKLGLDTSGVDKKLDETTQKVQALDPKIKAELNIDTTSKDGIETFIKTFDPSKYPKIVTFKADTKEVDEATEEVSEPIGREVRYYATGVDSLPNNFDDIQRAVHYYAVVDDNVMVPDVPSRANGTAHSSGTAKIGGDWGTASGGKTLVGELGREIVVDPRTGRWYTVGDKGAQFVDIPKGAIIFNHIQSQSLLENGYVTGRAHALVSGTAMVTGGIGIPNVGYSTKRKNRIAEEISNATASEISDSTPNGGDDNPEDSFKYIDRIEIFLDRIHRKINAVKDAISDVFSLWSTRGDNITKQIGNITDEIDTQQAAARRYLEEARKQIDKYGLDPEWVKDIESGGIGFSYLTNLDDLYEGYEEYKKWYDKYLDSRDTIAGLERDLSQLYKDQFDNIKKNYENQIDLSEYLRDSEEKTYSQSTTYFDDMRGVYSKNLELLTNEAKDLEEQLQKAIDSDAIEVGSEAWQEMKKEINGVTKEISKTNVELAKLYTEQFDYIQNNYNNQISSYESLNDANEKNFTATTNYFKEMRDISTKTLKTQKEELADLEREYEEAMASGRIEKGSEAWYKMCSAIDDTKRSISETRVELKQLYLDEFDYIQDGYKNQLSLYEYYSNAFQKRATLAETRGYASSRNILDAQQKVQKQSVVTLRRELLSLEKEFSEALSTGQIEEGSEAWYSMQSAINATKEAIYDSRIETEKLNKAMRELEWQRFEFKQSTVSQLNDEADFLVNMMSFTDLYDGKGRLTDTGLATKAMHELKADVLNDQLKEYSLELARNENALYSDPENVELLNHRQELLKLSRETALALENENKAIVSMVEDGIKLELDSLKELIDTYKEALDAEKDLYDYEKSISEKSKKLSDIQKQLSAYANDSSEEAKATVQKLKVDLTDAQKDLEETEYARSISDQKKLLDDVYTEYEKFLNARLDDTNKLLNDMRMITNAIPDRIGETLIRTASGVLQSLSGDMNDVWTKAKGKLDKWNSYADDPDKVTAETVTALGTSWGVIGDSLRGTVLDSSYVTDNKIDGIKTAVDINVHGIETRLSDLEHKGGQIIANTDAKAEDIKGNISDNTRTVQSGFTTTNDTLRSIKELVRSIEKRAEEETAPYLGDVNVDNDINSSDALKILRGAVGTEKLTSQEKALADMNGDGVVDSADALLALRMGVGLDLDKKTKLKSYSSGGLVDYTGIANVHGSKTNPEYVLSAKDTQNFIRLNDILRDAMRSQSFELFSGAFGIDAPALQLAKIPPLVSGVGAPNRIQDVQIVNNIEIDHVENYDDFVNRFRTDKKFEKMIRTMTVGDLSGGRSIDKYKYRW